MMGIDNYWLITTAVEILFFIFFILVLRRIFTELGFSNEQKNTATILCGLFPYDFIEDSLGTDLPALVFLLMFIFLIMVMVRGRQSAGLALLAAFSLIMAGTIRYPYVPVGLACSIGLILIPWFRNLTYLKAIRLTGLIGFIGLGLLLLFQQWHCGSPFYLRDVEKGIYPENLQYWHPVLLAALINIPTTATILSNAIAISYVDWLWVFQWINIIIAVSLLTYLLKRFRLSDLSAAEKTLIISGLFISVSILALLTFLSLTTAKYEFVNNYRWTFIAEGRYFAFLILFLQICLMAVFFHRKTLSLFVKILLCAALLIWCSSVLHQVYRGSKIILQYKEMKGNVTREQDYVYFMNYLDTANKKEELIVISSDQFYPVYAQLKGAKGVHINDLSVIENWDARHRSNMLIIVHDSEMQYYQTNLQELAAKKLMSFPGVQFFTVNETK